MSDKKLEAGDRGRDEADYIEQMADGSFSDTLDPDRGIFAYRTSTADGLARQLVYKGKDDDILLCHCSGTLASLKNCIRNNQTASRPDRNLDRHPEPNLPAGRIELIASFYTRPETLEQMTEEMRECAAIALADLVYRIDKADGNEVRD